MSVQNRVGFLGSVTLDLKLCHVSGSQLLCAHGKCDVNYELQPGGGAVNAARQAERLGADTRLVALVGNDDLGQLLQRRLRRDFRHSVTAPLLHHSRLSLISEDGCLTSRPELSVLQPPRELVQELEDCSHLLIGPALPADTDFLERLLDGLPVHTTTLLQLSERQLRDRAVTRRLVSRCSIVVVNEAEACSFSGRENPEAAFLQLAEECRNDVVMTSSTQVRARCAEGELVRAVRSPSTIRRPVGAGDVLAGTLLAAMADDREFGESLDLALAAAGIHITGRSMPAHLDELLAVAELCVQ
jgi:sugar/nucleoside kinase (ribokinase family)